MPETDRFLRMHPVLERVGFSRTTLYRKMQEETFPRQVQISDYCRGWRESAINRWHFGVAKSASQYETT